MERNDKALPSRKPNRLAQFDYGQPGAYFITACTRGRINRFWDDGIPANLSTEGKIVEEAIVSIPHRYPNVMVENYVIMPNHVHLLLRLSNGVEDMVTVSQVMQQWKGVISKEIGCPVWQKSFYDHVIRSDTDYWEIWRYIDENPQKWAEDRFYFS